jgi:hypothetical protein
MLKGFPTLSNKTAHKRKLQLSYYINRTERRSRRGRKKKKSFDYEVLGEGVKKKDIVVSYSATISDTLYSPSSEHD